MIWIIIIGLLLVLWLLIMIIRAMIEVDEYSDDENELYEEIGE